jgi:hypothetical protein
MKYGISKSNDKGMYRMDNKVTVMELIQMAADRAAETAILVYEKQKKNDKENRYQKRVHNTLLLLQNYRILKRHVEESVCEFKDNKDHVLDILDELEYSNFNDNIYVDSIKRSTQKTMIILEHVTKMVELFRKICMNSDKKIDIHKYWVIHKLFVDDEGWTVERIAQSIPCDRKMVYNYKNDAIEILSGLIFGLDGVIKNNSKGRSAPKAKNRNSKVVKYNMDKNDSTKNSVK